MFEFVNIPKTSRVPRACKLWKSFSRYAWYPGNSASSCLVSILVFTPQWLLCGINPNSGLLSIFGPDVNSLRNNTSFYADRNPNVFYVISKECFLPFLWNVVFTDRDHFTFFFSRTTMPSTILSIFGIQNLMLESNKLGGWY